MEAETLEKTGGETRKFDAEIGKVLHLMIHSLYTNKDIFLRELISNASDACDKARYMAVTTPEILANQPDLKITISSNEESKLLTISDTGIGMNREDLIENLGTIAKSGTQNFIKNLSGNEKIDTQLIGQFGVGFYSCFMVADHVIVKSRKAGEDKAWMWQSNGQGEFTIQEIAEEMPRGTTIILKMKEEASDYLDKFSIRHVVTTYSDHIAFPIELVDGEKTTVINKGSALWTRAKSEITPEQYQEFYRYCAHSGDEPALTLHNKNEGLVEYTNLIYIPSNKPFDLFHPDRKTRVKLYVKRVFITEDNVDIIPAWLRFIRGIVDSEDLPLNISRETLQNNHIIDKIRKSLVKRIISELKKLSESESEKYLKIWQNFGAVIKEGLCEGGESKDSLLEICKFHSLNSDKMITFDEYLANMKQGQENIYYLTGDDAEKLRHSPQLEGFKSKNVDVLLLTDAVDEFWVNVVYQYKEKELKSVTRSGIEFDKIESGASSENKAEETQSEKVEDDNNDLLKNFFTTVLGDAIKEVKISTKLTESPAVLTVAEGAMDIRMERFLLEQKQLASSSAKILEINSKHKLLKRIAADLKNHQESEETKDLARIIFDQACVIEGEPLVDAVKFCRTLTDMLAKVV